MAFPTTISTGGQFANVGGSKPYISSAGNVYVIIKSDLTYKIRAFKATDPTSSFSNVGTDVAVTSTNAIKGIGTYQVGDVIHVVTMDYTSVAAAIDLRYHTFDMSSDTWTLSNETIKDNMSFPASGTNADFPSISVRSNGDVIVFYNGPLVANMGSDRFRVYYARRVSAVWTVDVAVDNGGATGWYVNGMADGSSDRHHLYFEDNGALDGYQRCLHSDNTLETFPASYDTTLGGNYNYSDGASYDASGTQKVRVISQDATANQLNSVKLDSAATPTITLDTDITGATNPALSNFTSCFSSQSTNLWHAFIDSVNDIYTQSNANDGGWSTPASFYTGTATVIYSNVYTRGGDIVLGMVFVETDPKYTEKVLVQGGNAASISAAASVTWSGKSTAAGNMDGPAAAAVVTWNGKSTATSSFTQTAAAVLTWNGAAPTAAAFNSAAAASVTWNGASTAAVPFQDIAAAVLTWNGKSTATSAFSDTAAAVLTWNGASTSATAWSSTATASLTWNGTGLYSGAWSVTAAASVTWTGQEVAGGTIASGDWSSTAAAALTWNGVSTATADLSSAAVGNVTWNGISTATSDWNSIAAGSLTWNATSTATSAWNSAASASVTWNGTGLYPSAWSSSAAASLTATGAATASADLSATALATLTWNGTSSAAAAWNSAAAASQTWLSDSSAAAFNMTAVASLIAAGAATSASALSATGAGSLTWNGASTSSAAQSALAAAILTWNGTSTAVANLSALAAASVTWNGAATDTAAFSDTAAASVTWTGVAVSSAGSDLSIAAMALAAFTSQATASAAARVIAASSITWVGANAAAAVTRNLDGWKPKDRRIEDDAEMKLIEDGFLKMLEQNVFH